MGNEPDCVGEKEVSHGIFSKTVYRGRMRFTSSLVKRSNLRAGIDDIRQCTMSISYIRVISNRVIALGLDTQSEAQEGSGLRTFESTSSSANRSERVVAHQLAGLP